jgi:hypothetical protein
MFRVNVTHSCSEWHFRGLDKPFNPVVPHTPEGKQQGDHFRWIHVFSRFVYLSYAFCGFDFLENVMPTPTCLGIKGLVVVCLL